MFPASPGMTRPYSETVGFPRACGTTRWMTWSSLASTSVPRVCGDEPPDRLARSTADLVFPACAGLDRQTNYLEAAAVVVFAEGRNWGSRGSNPVQTIMRRRL